jgi:hypothetical protein
VQFDYKGKHYNVEFDTDAANGRRHRTTILTRDPRSVVICRRVW